MKTPSQSNPWIGRVIGDRQRYRLDRRLAAGGMGEVFVAMDILLGKLVAIKLLKDTLVASVELRRRFEREVALYAALKSDHIVEVSDYGVTEEGYPFFVMEYLRGQSLGQLLRQKWRLPLERTVNLIAQVCDGLQLAHTGVTIWRDNATVSEQIKVVHRDLKPDNIFLVPTVLGELVKILDFGVAKIRETQVEHTSVTNMFLGTFHYAAPEQLEVEKDLDERADIYSLGIIIYEMLSGTDPFGLGFHVNAAPISKMSWALAHTSKPVVPLRSQAGLSQIQPELEAVVMRCLKKIPDERFASVDELKRALQAVISNTYQSQQNLELTQRIINRGETHVPETHNFNPTISNMAEEPSFNPTLPINPTLPTRQTKGVGENKKARQLLLKTTAVVAVLLGVGLAYFYYPKGQIDQSQKTVLTQNDKLLARAKEFAQKNDFKDAISEANRIRPDSSLHPSAQQLINNWSLNIVKQAQEQYRQVLNSRDVEHAIDMTKAIPQTSSVAKSAKEISEKWRTEWNNNENYLKAAQEALKQGKWHKAIDDTNKVRLLGQKVKQDTPYWQKKVKPILDMVQKHIAGAKTPESRTNNPPALPPPQPIPSQVPYQSRPTVLYQPQQPVPYQPKPQVRHFYKPPAPYQPKPQVRHFYKPSAPYQPKPQVPYPPSAPQLSPEAQRILCQQFPLNSRCGSRH
ncbi:MAG: protein kinase [Chroococcidiopsidaceae cyanobacterium CP_BM_ER_R8_30]|nr:protein kinase [Chroococcidiopsidaceae cyanobacterium CP_BM_ER_R8_30]